ncbi:MAG: hypothetical protein Q9167_004112 [Letrouitia subvulpina]
MSARSKDVDFSSVLTNTISDDGVDNWGGFLGLKLLYSPSEPLIDFIFVHGLGGGSRKTWSKTKSISHYWPQEWLPKDPAFKNVRIQTFGYDSDWANGKENCLNIHHFGKSLLGEMSTSPYLSNANTPIMLIGHSMGDLVIKKAYMLARQSLACKTLTERFCALYFLATPHRGSDSAKLLNNVLQISYSSRAYVADLERGSGTIQSINDEFRNYSADIELWSFYETQKLKMGVLSKLIVDPDSATLGYRDEKQIPINADHRSICKFETPGDANYMVLRNAFASTVQNISKQDPLNKFIVLKTNEKFRLSQVKDLEKYLEAPEELDDDLVAVEDARMSGTCRWFCEKEEYEKWIAFAPNTPNIFWATGRPAAGKSVLAGYVIGQLQKTKADCSYFFFKHGDKSKSRLSARLRSLAFQMACQITTVRESLFQMREDGIKLTNESDRVLWRRLFLNGIFRTKLSRHFWIIDAIDECQNLVPFFNPMLAKLGESIPLRILVLSRETSELKKQFFSLGIHRVHHEKISVVDTLTDIKLMVEEKAKFVYQRNEEDRDQLVKKILDKSEGSFLWTTLVLSELSNAHSEEEISQALEDVPRDMGPLYQRTLETMTLTTVGRKLAKAVLIWATCAIRPLTTRELDWPLNFNVGDNFPKLEESILALCGHLVTIDKFGKLQMVHETAREFLLQDDLDSYFAINKTEAHTRIARACLTYLTGEEMRPPRTSRRGPSVNDASKRTEFSVYACAAFSYHLARADPLANDVLMLIEKFLKLNVLSWIEAVARTQNLAPMIRAAKNLRTYLEACTAERSPLGMSMSTIRGWTIDFEHKTLGHGEAVRVLQFKGKGGLLASCGMKMIRIWDAWSGRNIHSFEAPQRVVDLTFGNSILLAASSKNCLASWELDNGGARKPDRPWGDSDEHMNKQFRRPPCAISIAINHQMLAIAYYGRPIVLWDLEQDAYFGHCGKKLVHGETSTHRITALVFNPNPEINLLVASYLDGELVLLDPFNDQELESFRADCHVLAASPDGRLLAGGAGGGTIQVYEFDSLRLLYQVKSSDFYIKQLAFSLDSFHLSDIRGAHCNVWEPAILLRNSVGDDSSEGTLVSSDGIVATETRVKVSTIILHPEGDVAFCSKNDGAVSIYDLKTGFELRTLYRHKSLVRILTWWPQSKAILSVDASNGIFQWHLEESQKEGWVAAKTIFKSRLDCGKSIVQVLFGAGAGKLILSTRVSDHLWSIDGQQLDERIYSDKSGIRKWIQHQQSSLHVICVEIAVAQIYSWKDWSKVASIPLAASVTGLQLKNVFQYGLGHQWRLIFELSELDGSPGTRGLQLFDGAVLDVECLLTKEAVSKKAKLHDQAKRLSIMDQSTTVAKASAPVQFCGPQLATLTHRISHIIGLDDANRLLFLDIHSWVCTADLESLGEGSIIYWRHFFLPYDWFAGTRDLVCAVARRDVLFARNNDVAIIKNGLEFAERVDLEVNDSRPPDSSI